MCSHNGREPGPKGLVHVSKDVSLQVIDINLIVKKCKHAVLILSFS